MQWNNRVTQILGTKYPITLGAMQGFGKSSLAAPVSEAGGFGVITAHCFRTPDLLREDIRKARSMTDKPFGVNFSVGFVRDMDAMLDAALDEGIKVIETSIMPSAQHGKRAHEAGAKWIHKGACVEHAIAAEAQGADAVIIVGVEGFSFKTLSQLPTLVGVSWAAKQMKIPIIAAGGIGDGRTFAAALAAGAEGVCMGTGFLATNERPLSPDRKQELVDAKPSDPLYRDLAMHVPSQDALKQVMAQRTTMPLDQWLRRLETTMWGRAPGENRKMAGGSLAVAFIDGVVPVKDLIENVVSGAEHRLTNDLRHMIG